MFSLRGRKFWNWLVFRVSACVVNHLMLGILIKMCKGSFVVMASVNRLRPHT